MLRAEVFAWRGSAGRAENLRVSWQVSSPNRIEGEHCVQVTVTHRLNWYLLPLGQRDGVVGLKMPCRGGRGACGSGGLDRCGRNAWAGSDGCAQGGHRGSCGQIPRMGNNSLMPSTAKLPIVNDQHRTREINGPTTLNQQWLRRAGWDFVHCLVLHVCLGNRSGGRNRERRLSRRFRKSPAN